MPARSNARTSSSNTASSVNFLTLALLKIASTMTASFDAFFLIHLSNVMIAHGSGPRPVNFQIAAITKNGRFT